MLKHFLIFIGAAFLLLLLICGGILFWAQQRGSEKQGQFFQAVDSGKASEVLDLCDPALRDEIDEPILSAWIAEVRRKLGRYQGLSKTNFHTSTKINNDGSLTESQGEVLFEHGTAQSELVFRNDRLIKFSIESKQIPDDWFQGPEETSLYRSRGEKFLKHFLHGETEAAFAMMHPKLQEVVSREKLKEMFDTIRAQAGKEQSITYKREAFSTQEGQKLDLYYEVKCERAALTGHVDFRFVGMKGHLVEFNLKGE